MRIELDGAAIALAGEENPIATAALEALIANGGRRVPAEEARDAAILLLSCPLLPGKGGDARENLESLARDTAAAMARRGDGRILFLLSAIAGMPMRRYPDFSREAAAPLTAVRTLAMQFGPHVLVNAVGLGMVEADALVSGDQAQLSHTPVGRPGTVEEAVAAVLFFCDPMNTYTTGQMLAVDGGWSAGYGRNF